jgi:hypothetical protein
VKTAIHRRAISKANVKLFTISVLMLGFCVLCGCGGNSSSGGVTPTPTPTPTPGPGISGHVYGGSPEAGEPIGGSQITLYQAGATGYGAGAYQLAQTASDSNGAFDIPAITCQTSGYSQQIYLVATGGTIKGQSGANAATGFISAVGTCASFAHETVVNEATTVATVWTLDQFLDASGQTVGTSSTNQTGLNNAAATITATNFVDPATGLAPIAFPPGVISPTPTLYSLANILASCVDSSGANSTECQNLFTAATPSGGAAPTTTLQAAVDIARNPANNVGDLFALEPVNAPFAPALAVEPASWALTLNYAPTAAAFNSPYMIAVDGAGNVWVANAASNSVSELTGASGYITGLNFAPAGASLNFPVWLAIDAAGNVWVANFKGNSVGELTNASGYASGLNFAPAGAAFNGPSSIELDSAGNLWITNFSGDSVSELLAGCSSASCTGVNFTNSNTGTPGAVFSGPFSSTPDELGNLWVANYSGNSVSELLAGCSNASCTGVNFNNSNTGSPGAGFGSPVEIAVNGAGDVLAVNLNSNSVSELPAGCTTSSCAGVNFNNTNTGIPGASFSSPNSIAVDAGSNVWATNSVDDSVSELTAASAYGFGLNLGPWPTRLSEFSIAVDAGGNIWIANNYEDGVNEIVGVATPTLTPVVACLNQGKEVCMP